MAQELGADAVELDARRTVDGVLVVHHDDAVAGADRPIVAMTRSELDDMAPWVPDLADALAACAEIWVDVEIKNDPREADWDPENHVARTIADLHRDADIVVTSFNPDTIAMAGAAGLRTGWLVGRGIDPIEAVSIAADAGHEFVLPHYSMLAGNHGEHVVEAGRRAGVEIAVWTVDDPDEMIRLATVGVGGIATNVPGMAHSTLARD